MRRGYQDTQGIFALTAGLVLAASLGLFGLRGVDNASVDAPIGGVTGALSIGRFDAPPAPIALDLPFPALHSWGTEAAAAALAPRMSYSAAIQARDAGDGGAAVEAFRTVAASNHVLAPVAELRLAQLLVSSGDHPGAVPHFMAAADNPVLPHPLRSVAFSEGVSALRAAGDTAGAVAALERRAQDPSATDGQRADAMWRSALIRREQGDGGWVGAAHSAVSTAPASLAAREALDALEATGNNHEVLETALVRYRANQDGIARELYTQIVDGRVQPSPGPAGIATAWYYLGALAERRGATVEA